MNGFVEGSRPLYEGWVLCAAWKHYIKLALAKYLQNGKKLILAKPWTYLPFKTLHNKNAMMDGSKKC